MAPPAVLHKCIRHAPAQRGAHPLASPCRPCPRVKKVKKSQKGRKGQKGQRGQRGQRGQKAQAASAFCPLAVTCCDLPISF